MADTTLKEKRTMKFARLESSFLLGTVIGPLAGGFLFLITNETPFYVFSFCALIAAIGIENLIIIETSDAILVADKSQSQEVKNIVNLLKEKGILEGQEHKRIYRPWGYYESIIDEERWQVKIIHVKQGAKLYLQKSHFHQ